MNSSNSFNICPRCGNSNSLNAKYCSRCGTQLKVPQEAVVCHKCHTRNSSLANFCRNCGATLKVGAQTKICPRCGREIGADENVCACGYSFVTLQQTEPRPVIVASTNKSKKDKKHDKKHQEQQVVEQQTEQQNGKNKSKTKTAYSNKGGRGFAIFATLLLAVFCYLIIAPASARLGLSQYDKGFYNGPASLWVTPEEDDGGENASVVQGGLLYADDDGEEPTITPTNPGNGGEETPTTPDDGNETGNTSGNGTSATDEELHYVYGFDCIQDLIDFGKNFETMQNYEGGMFAYLLDNVGQAGFVMLVLFSLFLITAAFHAVVCIVRIFTKRRSKGMNIIYLILAVATTILVALMVCSQMLPQTEGFLAEIKAFFAPMNGHKGVAYGYALFLIPVYYWVFWLYSCLAKAKKIKKAA